MKQYKSFLLASAVVSILAPSTFATPTAEDIAARVRSARPAIVQVEEAPAKKGWGSYFSKKVKSFRKNVGNAFRNVGDRLRTEDNETNIGVITEAAKELAAKAAAAKTKLPITKRVFNYVGNGLRRIGQWIKGGQETQTPTRIVMDNLGLNKSSKQTQVEEALELAAKVAVKADPFTSEETFKNVAQGLDKRGHSTIRDMDLNKVYIQALVAEKAMTAQSFEEVSDFVRMHGSRALDEVKVVKEAATQAKLGAMESLLQDMYRKEALLNAAKQHRARVLAHSAAAAA